ncbi:hypothetical protein BDW60DRAFT_78610 [Aspergillus nidulans var. acristatus]
MLSCGDIDTPNSALPSKTPQMATTSQPRTSAPSSEKDFASPGQILSAFRAPCLPAAGNTNPTSRQGQASASRHGNCTRRKASSPILYPSIQNGDWSQM